MAQATAPILDSTNGGAAPPPRRGTPEILMLSINISDMVSFRSKGSGQRCLVAAPPQREDRFQYLLITTTSPKRVMQVPVT
jgi:hypothetical protein